MTGTPDEPTESPGGGDVRVFGLRRASVHRYLDGCAFASLAVVVLLVGYMVYWHVAHRPEKTVALRAGLPAGDVIEFGWVRTRTLGYGGWEYWNYLAWERSGSRQEFLIYAMMDGPMSCHVEVRMAADHDRVWLVDRARDSIMATLDLRRGEFRDVNGWVRNGRWSLAKQVREGSGPDDHPEWATPDGGELVAEWDRRDGPP